MSEEPEVLRGGVGNAGAVVRVGDHVLRPVNPHSPGIHALLAHLHRRGFASVPEVLGVERSGDESGGAGPDRVERLRFIEGDVPIPPFPAWSQTDACLASTVSLLRRFHDAAEGFVPLPDTTWSDELADPTPGEQPVPCHNDVCPENVVYRSGRAVALLDFDFVAPGRRVWDLASLARMCVPIDTDEDAALTGRRGLDPVTRLRVVADAYGLDTGGRSELLDVLGEQFERGGDFVRRRVEAGEPAFIAMWEAMGGQARYDRRRDWFGHQRPRFEGALFQGSLHQEHRRGRPVAGEGPG